MAYLIEQFRDVIRSRGLEPPDFLSPGKIHRFPGFRKGKSNRAGWCLLFDDFAGGCFGDWSTGLSENWHAKPFSSINKAERDEYIRQTKATKARARSEHKLRQANVAARAQRIWKAATPARFDHPYLLLKKIQPNNARVYNEALLLPVVDFTGELTSLQFIQVNGTKRLLSGGRKQGCFIQVAFNPGLAEQLIICEGWATGCALAEYYPDYRVMAAIDAGNLKFVATSARHYWPDAKIIIAGDDDRNTKGNPGATKASEAALASGARLALPQWPADAPQNLTDFNDLPIWLSRQTEHGGAA